MFSIGPSARPFAIAGILSGLALTGEFILFGASGFPGAGFSDPAVAIPYLRSGGTLLLAAVLFGAAGVAISSVFYIGLAAVLHRRTPVLGLATGAFGLMGNVGDGLVALSFWTGVPVFLQLTSRDQAVASSAWPAFAAATGGFGAFGNLFLGLSLLIAGWSIVSARTLTMWLGLVGIACGLATIAAVLGVQATYFVSLILVVVFRIWAGIAMLRLPSVASEAAARPASAA